MPHPTKRHRRTKAPKDQDRNREDLPAKQENPT